MYRALTIALVLAVAVLVAGLQPASATILTFSHIFGSGTISPMPQVYGDYVSATDVDQDLTTNYTYGEGNGFTPNVLVDYSSPNSTVKALSQNVGGLWNDGVAYLPGNAGGEIFNFGLTPDAPYGVKVNSFQLTHWVSDGTDSVNWAVLGGASTLASGTASVTGAPTTTTVTTGLTGFYAGVVTVRITKQGTVISNDLGLNDLNFDQQYIPEPSTLVLLAAGLVGLLCYAWRKRK